MTENESHVQRYLQKNDRIVSYAAFLRLHDDLPKQQEQEFFDELLLCAFYLAGYRAGGEDLCP